MPVNDIGPDIRDSGSDRLKKKEDVDVSLIMQDDKLPSFSTMQLTSTSTNDTWIKPVENVSKEIRTENLNLSVGYTPYAINSKEADYAHSTEEGKRNTKYRILVSQLLNLTCYTNALH